MKINQRGSTISGGKSNVFWGTASVMSVALFLFLVLALNFLQPELNPMTTFVSEYVAGQSGWLLKIAFFGQGAAQIFLAVGLYRLQNPRIRSLAGSVLLVVSGVASFGSGIFDSDLPGAEPTQTGMIHDQVGYIWFLSFLAASFIYSRKLRLANKVQGILQVLPYLPWLVVIMFIAMIFVFGLVLNLPGLGQRLVMAAVLSWLYLMARALQTGELEIG